MLIGGFDGDGKPRLFMTEPSGSCTEWVAATIGRNDKVVREYLEKNFGENLSEAETLKLAVQGLLEVVEPDPNCMEISILRGAGIETLTNEKIQEVINAAKEE
jgi:20S proteasome alpha/beta subunit